MDDRRAARRARRAEQESQPPAVVLRGLRKHFGHKIAVAGIDLDVPARSFFGLVGPNGAGKTTTLRMATALLRPDAGTVHIAGIEVWREPQAAKAIIGVLPEDVPLFDRLTGWELLEFSGLLRSMPPAVIADRAAELLDVLALGDASGTLVVDYSQGMRKKIGLACALLHAPKALFLDEPFESVDPVSSRTIREVLTQFTSGGGTVVFSSHVMETVERLCDRVAIVHEGRIVATGPLDEVAGARGLEETFVALVGARPDTTGRLTWLRSSSG